MSGAVRREETEILGVRRHVLEGTAPEKPGSPAEELTAHLLEEALRLGCAAAGIFPIEPFREAESRLTRWLEEGRHGTMTYLQGGRRGDPRALLAEAQSGLIVAVPYAAAPKEPLPAADGRPAPKGRVARYAQGDDYHGRLRMLLLELADACARKVGRPVLARACVDTAPLLEREAARRAGLSFFGKNTLAIVPGVGSYVLLGELLLDVELPSGWRVVGERRQAVPRAGCGSCTRCLDACPTGAFVGPYELDARRCISYLTIEYDGVIPEELREPIGDHVFGCDICQDVCPFNRSSKPRPPSPLGHYEHLEAPDLIALLELTSSGYRRLVAGTALRRVSRARLARNAAVALGNVGDERALQPLARALAHPSALVRGHAAWALGQLLHRLGPADLPDPELQPRTEKAREALAQASQGDADEDVRAEARRALGRLSLAVVRDPSR